MMRTIALLSIAVCAGATSVQAQEAEKIVVAPGGYGNGCNAGVHFGCCEKDVSHCFELWSTYCQERRSPGVCSPRRALHAQNCGHCGIFDFNLGGCCPKIGFCAPACEDPSDCESSDDCVGSGCDYPMELTAPGAAEDEPMPPQDDLDSAEDIEQSPSDLVPGDAPPMPPQPDTSAGRWYLPFKWKK